MEAIQTDPKSLLFTERDQTSIAAVAERFSDGITNAIVAVEGEQGLAILDGHNRAAVAIANGWNVPVVSISAAQHEALIALGFDDMEISFAALLAAGEENAAYDIHNQFRGAGIAERGIQALAHFE